MATFGMATFGKAMLIAAGLAMHLSDAAQAQTYPAQPVHFTVAFAPAGPADLIARIVGQRLGEKWGQQPVIENRGGAGGNIAAAAAAKAEPNGYTVLVTTSALAVNVTLSNAPGFKADDFKTAVIVATTPNLIVGANNLKATTLKEVVAAAAAEKFTYGSAGTGTTPHLSAERIFKIAAKVDIPHAPFTGAGPALNAVIGGHIALASLALPTAVEQVLAGQVKPLAVTSKERVAALPNVPTAKELGFGDEEDSTWVAFFVPAKTPEAVVAKLNADVNAILKDEATKQQLGKIGFMPVGGSQAEAESYVRSEIAKWADVIKKIDLKMP
jgi:tripartite-type tricarboxylate transporter receptor subunit TctC